MRVVRRQQKWDTLRDRANGHFWDLLSEDGRLSSEERSKAIIRRRNCLSRQVSQVPRLAPASPATSHW